MSEFLSSSKFDEVKQRIKCEYCDKTYSNRSNLQQHLESVHMQLVHRCPDCDAPFTRKSHLRQHVRSIHEFVRYACEQCDYLATTEGHLKQHVRAVHEKLREYQCVLCHLMFSQRVNLSTDIFELFTTEFVPSSVKSARNHSHKPATCAGTKNQNNISFD